MDVTMVRALTQPVDLFRIIYDFYTRNLDFKALIELIMPVICKILKVSRIDREAPAECTRDCGGIEQGA
jgi:hypothetical protein